MDVISACPACAHTELRRWPSLVAPFIADYVLRGPIEPCELCECERCSLRFFDHRYNAAEISRLYGNYRGEGYFRTRHHREPWYSRAFNDGIGLDAEVQKVRKAHALEWIARAKEPASIASVLDYGGDAGQFIPDGLGAARFVYELSDARPVAGVVKVSRESELVAHGYDAVLLCHVLEHHADPAALIERVARLLKPGGVLYVEVPHERVSMMLAGGGWLAHTWLGLVRRISWLAVLLDFYSTALRVKAGFVPPLGFVKLHEHLNFFDVHSLGTLVSSRGLDVIDCEATRWPGETAGTHDEVVCCIATPRKD